MTSTLIGKRAVVIGAGMAGLTAAAALADRFDQVVVLERDTLPSEPTYRAGTPQARHVHGLLFSGQRVLSELFPGFEQDLARAGAVSLRAGLDVRVERPGYDPFPQRDLGWSGYAASRPTIERAVRQRVESHATTTLRQRCRVKKVLASPDGAVVTGVRCEKVSFTPLRATGQFRAKGALLALIGHFPHRKTRRSRYLRPDPQDEPRSDALAPHSRPRESHVEPSQPSTDGSAGSAARSDQLREKAG
jgi:flavin-dependent dehydrogenase